MNINLLSTPRSPKWSLPFSFSDLKFVRISHVSHACYMPLPRVLPELISLYYMMKITNNEAPNYEIFSVLLLIPLSKIHIIYPTTYPQLHLNLRIEICDGNAWPSKM